MARSDYKHFTFGKPEDSADPVDHADSTVLIENEKYLDGETGMLSSFAQLVKPTPFKSNQSTRDSMSSNSSGQQMDLCLSTRSKLKTGEDSPSTPRQRETGKQQFGPKFFIKTNKVSK